MGMMYRLFIYGDKISMVKQGLVSVIIYMSELRSALIMIKFVSEFSPFIRATNVYFPFLNNSYLHYKNQFIRVYDKAFLIRRLRSWLIIL